MEKDDNLKCDGKETDDDDTEEFLPGFATFQDYSKVWHAMIS